MALGHQGEGLRKVDSLYLLLPENKKSKNYKALKLLADQEKALVLEQSNQDQKALELCLKIADEAMDTKLYPRAIHNYLFLEIIYEKIGDWPRAKFYLNKAFQLIETSKLYSFKSEYYVRSSSYFRLTGNKDSALVLARKSLEYAQKYDTKRWIPDAYMLIGMLLPPADYKEAIQAHRLAQQSLLDMDNALYTSAMYNNIAMIYKKQNQPDIALLFNDSAIRASHNLHEDPPSSLFMQRANLFTMVNEPDSALKYYAIFHDQYVLEQERDKTSKIEEITRQYDFAKKESIIQNRNLWLGFALMLAVLLTAATLFFMRQNKKISTQNTIIKSQLAELKSLVRQKENLLAELQHRVKNNLQQMISLLEIQQDSLGHSNIEEAIRETKNRIQSMALLHSRLIINEDLSEIDFKKYLTELSQLVAHSYQRSDKSISIQTSTTVTELAIDTAIPLGQIIVELMSNSLKHAFKNQPQGVIKIDTDFNTALQKTVLTYSDNGTGFDFAHVKTNGLGLEIIKGLTGQINGRLQTSDKQTKGFELSIYF